MEMDKIPTPVIIGGGAILALIAVKALGNSGPSIKTIGPTSDPGADQIALAHESAVASGFNTLVTSVTQMDTELARLSTGITLENIRGRTLTDISKISADVQAKKDKLEADAVRQTSSDQLAAQRSVQKGETTRDVVGKIINFGVKVIGHLFGF
jgi:hypothetical protein